MIAMPASLRQGSALTNTWANPIWKNAISFVWIALRYVPPVYNYLQASLIIPIAYVAFVPIYVKPAPMNVQNLIVKYASNVPKNAESVQKAAKKWQLNLWEREKYGYSQSDFQNYFY